MSCSPIVHCHFKLHFYERINDDDDDDDDDDEFSFSALTLLAGRQEGHPTCKKLDVGFLVVMIWLELCTTYSSCSPVVTTTSIILCFKEYRLTQVHLENCH